MRRKKAVIQLINNSSEKDFPLKSYKLLIEEIICGEKIAVKEINAILVDDEYLRKLHKKYLNNDTYTDVMTFNLSESGEIEAEIYISYDRAKLHAHQFKVPVTDELARLFVHGLLHLKGYDDRTPAEQQEMHKMENRLLKDYWKKSEEFTT